MKAAILVLLLTLDAVPALAQSATTYTISPRNGSTQMIQGSDGSVYNYSYDTSGNYIVQKDGAHGSYQVTINPDGSGLIQNNGANFSLPGQSGQ